MKFTVPCRMYSNSRRSISPVRMGKVGRRRSRVLQEEMLRVQEATLRALSTPLLPIAEGVVVMPLIGTLDAQRAQQALETQLAGVVDHQTAQVILDITGVPVVDDLVASALARTAKAVRLLGAQVLLTGVQPATARTLIDLGVDLGGIRTLSTLQSGVAYALAARGRGERRPAAR
ncbi:STAS domain-containing protein [Sorangium sp. So ce233]|uniref:STAS domain-containing protein n=1 Tax=Sorangium sp. So ce233 TaxID=3133290 RepID=UPI003F5F5AF0